MSIQSDFHMYYRNSLIGFSEGGVVKPLYVQRVDTRDSESRIEDLVYVGYTVTDARGNTEDRSIRHSSAILPLPEVGYIKPSVRNQSKPIWLSYRAIRGNCKGLSFDRLVAGGLNELSPPVMYSIYNPSFNGRFSLDCCQFEDKLMWRGAEIGNFRGDSRIVIPSKLFYLKNELERITPCQVIVDR